MYGARMAANRPLYGLTEDRCTALLVRQRREAQAAVESDGAADDFSEAGNVAGGTNADADEGADAYANFMNAKANAPQFDAGASAAVGAAAAVVLP